MTQLEISFLLALKNLNLTLSADLKGWQKDIKWTKLLFERGKKTRQKVMGKGRCLLLKRLELQLPFSTQSVVKKTTPTTSQPKKEPPCLCLGSGQHWRQHTAQCSGGITIPTSIHKPCR